jgi:hypothetical protein
MDTQHGVSPRSYTSQILRHILSSASEIAYVKHDVAQLLDRFSKLAHDIVPSDRCSIWIYDRPAKQLWTKYAEGVETIRISCTHGIVGSCFMEKTPLIINAPYEDIRFDPSVDTKTGYTTENIIALPLISSEGEPLGVFQMLNKLDSEGGVNPGGYTMDDEQLLNIVAMYIARELDAFFLREELTQTQKEIIYTLAETGEMRSRETGNHVKRVAEYCRFMGNCCGYGKKDVEVLSIASTLHDIGKIAIPDTVLLKPGPVTAAEFDTIKTHCTLGYNMLRHSTRDIFDAAATIALQHHEKWDGSGYPQGYAGEEIHQFGRITAIADVYDALASRRCYKDSWEENAITDFFIKERGKHFDPVLTDIFLDNRRVFCDIRKKLKDASEE